MAVHRNGDLYVAYGRYLHRLNRHWEPLAQMRLPVHAPYNSFVILGNGIIVTKNLSDSVAARLTVVNPETMQRACADIDCPEASIARLSAIGNTLYVVGVRSIFRYHWSDTKAALDFDTGWRFDYIGDTTQTYGWDVVLDGQHAWFMDNGKHSYLVRSSNDMNTPGSFYCVAPRTRNSTPKSVFPEPARPLIRVGRPRGNPPKVISSKPWIPVDAFGSVWQDASPALFFLAIRFILTLN